MSYLLPASMPICSKSGLFLAVLSIVITALPSSATLPLHKKPPTIELTGSCGGRLDGSAWTSADISGKVFSVYYIDPDEADINEPLFATLKAEHFPADKVQSVAIINMRATWMPESVLSMVLKGKQKKYPLTLYVKDTCKKLISAWGLRDHSSDILLFNASGEVLFSVDGKLTDAQIGEVVEIVWQTIGSRRSNVDK